MNVLNQKIMHYTTQANCFIFIFLYTYLCCRPRLAKIKNKLLCVADETWYSARCGKVLLSAGASPEQDEYTAQVWSMTFIVLPIKITWAYVGGTVQTLAATVSALTNVELEKNYRCLFVRELASVLVYVSLLVIVSSGQFISILHCLNPPPPPGASLPHANKSLLSVFDFANANQLLAENRTPRAPVYQKQMPDTRWCDSEYILDIMPSGGCLFMIMTDNMVKCW